MFSSQGAASSAHRSRCVSAIPRLHRLNTPVRKVGPEDPSAVFGDCDRNPCVSTARPNTPVSLVIPMRRNREIQMQCEEAMVIFLNPGLWIFTDG